jgi:hypothetical protein
MNGDPLGPRAGFLALVLEQVVILVEDEALDRAVAELVVEIFCAEPDPDRIAASWDRVVAAMVRLEEGCVGGPLQALIFNEMNDLSHVNRGPFDLCLALALQQALPLLPEGVPFLSEAVDLLVNEAERIHPTPDDDLGFDVGRLDMEVAHLLVTDALRRIVALRIGGALAVLLLGWMRNRHI